MRTIRTRGALGAAALVCALWAPAVASAAEKPVATTGGAANIAPTSVVLNANVNPKGAETTYFFQYGTTVIYGALTPSASAGKGTAARRSPPRSPISRRRRRTTTGSSRRTPRA